MTTKTISVDDVKKIASLANLPLSPETAQKMGSEFHAILDLVGKLKEIDTTGVVPTSQVTGLVNVFRKDVIEESLSQEQALSNGRWTFNGYFVVNALFE